MGTQHDAAHAASPSLTRPRASSTGCFWGSLGLSLVVVFVVALPVNRWLIARGLGHAVVHGQHAM